MYLETCTIRNIKCFENMTLDFRNLDGSVRLWNVLIGENGTGKTTLLQAIAIALMGEKATSVFFSLPRPNGWVRDTSTKGTIEASIRPHDDYADDISDEERATFPDKPFSIYYDVLDQQNRRSYIKTTIAERTQDQQRKMSDLIELGGWFAAGYGPFRRFSGSSNYAQDILENGDREARFVTLFYEEAALTNSTKWLTLRPEKRNWLSDADNQLRGDSRIPLEEMQIILNNYLLPKDIQLDTFSEEEPLFHTPYAKKLPLSELSDGYRTLLVLTLDLLQRLFDEYWFYMSLEMVSTADNDLPRTDVLRYMPGVVLIDELDAHLHPSLQREIAVRLKKFFPELQFIIATHSPFITQAADDNGVYILQRDGNSVQALHEEKSVRGWRVDQILTSHLFGLETTRSPEVATLLEQYDELLAKRIKNTITAEETILLAKIENELRDDLPSPGETPEQRERNQRMQDYISKTIGKE